MSEPWRAPFEDPVRRRILDRYGIQPDAFLGSGGEAHVFALDHERVLRLCLDGLRRAAAVDPGTVPGDGS